MSYKKSRLSNGPCTCSETGKENTIIGEKHDTEDVTCNDDLLNPQYVNVEAQAASAEKGKVFTKNLQAFLLSWSILHSFILFEIKIVSKNEVE